MDVQAQLSTTTSHFSLLFSRRAAKMSYLQVLTTINEKNNSKISKCDKSENLVLSEDSAGHVALAEVVLDSALLGSTGLGEGSRATEWASESSILETDNADVVGATSRAGAGHASWHLDLDWEVHNGGSGETTNSDTWNVLGDLSVLESSWILSTGCGVDLSRERTSTILVDLVEGHGDLARVGCGWHAGCGTSTSSTGDTFLDGALLGGCASGISSSSGLLSTSKTAEDLIELALLVASHEGRDGLVGINWTLSGTAKSRGSATHLTLADNCSILL